MISYDFAVSCIRPFSTNALAFCNCNWLNVSRFLSRKPDNPEIYYNLATVRVNFSLSFLILLMAAVGSSPLVSSEAWGLRHQMLYIKDSSHTSQPHSSTSSEAAVNNWNGAAKPLSTLLHPSREG